MLKKTLTYENLDGKKITEDFYFNMTKAELIKLNLKEGEGFQEYLTRIVESGDGAAIVENFEKIVRLSYGVKTADGKFKKDPDDFDAFMATEAYSDFFLELVTDAKASSEFIKAVMPDNLVEEVQAAQQSIGISENLAAHLDVQDEPAKKTDRRKMSKAELLAAYKEKNDKKIAPHPYKDMALDKAMNLSPLEFEVWVNVNQ